MSNKLFRRGFAALIIAIGLLGSAFALTTATLPTAGPCIDEAGNVAVDGVTITVPPTSLCSTTTCVTVKEAVGVVGVDATVCAHA